MKSNTIVAGLSALFIVMLSASVQVNAQDRHLDTLYSYQPALMSSDDVLSLTGEGSFIHSNTKTPLSDDILLYPNWLKGVVNFNNGKQAADIELKFNLVKNELYFNNGGKLNYFADTVTSFSIYDTSGQMRKIASFCNGYPAFGQQTSKTYYLVLTSGARAHLLKYVSKKKQEIYQYSAPAKTEYVFREDMLVYDVKNNILKPVKNNAASLIKALPAYTAVIQQSLKDKNAKNLSDEEILNTIRQVNDANSK